MTINYHIPAHKQVNPVKRKEEKKEGNTQSTNPIEGDEDVGTAISVLEGDLGLNHFLPSNGVCKE
tara:strand:- start:204 stop:398 length:195 start_codon:yes stop_codon:yes gene_type:complete